MREQLLDWAQNTCDHVMNWRTYPPARPGVAPPRVVAHRGAWDARAPENTLAAFTRAKELGAWGIEFDLHFTQDDVPVVSHDPDLWRTHGERRVLGEVLSTSLRGLTPQLAFLEDVVALKGLHFMIEAKTKMSAAQAAIVARALGGREPVRDYHFLTLDSSLVRVSSVMPSEAWVLVTETNVTASVRQAQTLRLGGVAGHYLFMTRSHIDVLHARRQKVGVGFVPTRNLYQREWGRGVDWAFTNSVSVLEEMAPR